MHNTIYEPSGGSYTRVGDYLLPGYLTEIDGQAQEMFSRLIEQYAATEGITEQLKAEDQLAWVGRMNSIRERVEEIVLSELVYC